MQSSIEDTLMKAVAAHEAGDIKNAERLYLEIIRVKPRHPDAHHNLGVIAVSENKLATALQLFKTAVSINPRIEQFWLSYIKHAST